MPQTLYKPLDQPFTSYLPKRKDVPKDDPGFIDVVSAGFAQTNIIANMIELGNKKSFPEEPNFDLSTSLKSRGLWDTPDRDNYVGVKSNLELDYRVGRVAKQRKDQDTLARAGWGGLAAMAAGGLVDPTIFIPFLKAPTLGGAALKGALLVGGTVAAEEAIIQANQETRTAEEGVFAITSGTILGGILGGAVHGLRPGQLNKMADDMVQPPRDEAISTPMPHWDEPSTTGAYQIAGEGGRLKSERVTKPVIGKLSRLNPLTRLIQQDSAPSHMPNGSPLAREIGGKFGQAGLRLEGNVQGLSAMPGGNIENVIKGYAGMLDTANRAIERAFIDYVTDGAPARMFALSRARIGARLDNSVMNFPEFKEQVFLALAHGDHENTLVKKAADAARALIDELYEEGVAAKVFSGEEKVKGDKGYISHLWDQVKIKSNENELVQVFAQHYEQKKLADFEKAYQKLLEKQSKAGNFIADAQRPAEEIEKLKKQFEAELQELEDNLPFEVAQAKLEASNLRERAKKFVGTSKFPNENEAMKQSLRDRARLAEESGGPALKQYNLDKRQLKTRLANLRDAKVEYDRKLLSKVSKIEKNEDLQIETIYRAAKQAQKLLALISKGTDEEVAQELTRFKNMFEKTAEAFDNAEERIVKLTEAKDNAIDPVLDMQDRRMTRMDELAERIDEIDSFDKDALISQVDEAAKLLIQTHAEVNARRAVRNERLTAQARKLTPEEWQKKFDAKVASAKALAPEFRERFRLAGGENIDTTAGKVSFSAHAEQMAQDTVEKLKGTERRLAYSDIIQDARGPELARVLDIPADKVLKWLETDIQKVLTVYTRTVGADNTIARAFGTADMSETLIKLTDESKNAIKVIREAKNAKGEPLSDAAKNKLEFETNSFYTGLRNDIYTLLERARGMRGIPKDPYSASARLGQTAIDINNVRYMGGAAVASIPDPARIVQKHSLLRTFKDGFIPLITSFKDVKLAAREARLAGTANEIASHSRLNALTNVFDDTYRGTTAERGLHFLSTRMGLVSGLAQWTQAWQSMSSIVVNARLLDSIGIMMGEKASAKELAKATEYLASVNITPDIAQVIYKEVTNGIGGNSIRGVRLPNTELWNIADPNVKNARRAYRAALAGEIDDTIIKPGFEKASWQDAGLGWRLFGQFKSFALSSTQKTVMAGLQEHDMAYVNGMMISLAMGALSYYLYAVAAGGKTYDTMVKSIEDGNWELWADEAVSRSGQTAIFDSVQRVANRIPVVNKVSSFSGGPRTKSIGGGVVEELTGPSGDLIRKLGGIISTGDLDAKNYGMDRHTEHMARQLLPFQNLFYTRRLFDQIENATGDAFGLEGKRL